MLGSVSLVAPSARVRSLFILVVALLAMLGVLTVLAARADAVEVQPTNFPLPGSDFEGGDGNQANPTAGAKPNPAPYPANVDWQHLAGFPGLVHAADPNALDTTFDTGSHENNPLGWDLDFDPDGLRRPRRTSSTPGTTSTQPPATPSSTVLRPPDSGGKVFLAFELNQDKRQWKTPPATRSSAAPRAT